jgi:hypothetical protein
MTVRRAAAAIADFGMSRHWHELRRGKEGWAAAPALTRELTECFAATVGEAVSMSGQPPAELEFVVATRYGTAHVAEVMHAQLREAGPKWLDPEQFLYYAPHALLSATALTLGIGGAGSTLLGPDAEFQAVAHAVRRIRTGRAEAVVVAAYEALTPFAAAALTGHTGEGAPPNGQVTALVLGGEGTSPTVTPHRSLEETAVRSLAEDAGAPILSADGGLLRTLSAAEAPAVLTTGEGDRRDVVVVTS